MSFLETKQLGDICLNITDGKHGDCQNQNNSGYYFISSKDVYAGSIHYEDARQIKQNDFKETHLRTKLEVGDILITNSGTIGRMALIKEGDKVNNTTFQKSVALLKPNNEKVISEYLYYLLLSNYKQLVNLSGGAAQHNLLLGDLRKFKVYVPNLVGQRKIAYVLSTYDDLIENNEKRIKILEEMAMRLYREWFVKFKFPGHEKVKMVDSGTEYGMMPEGWEVVKIGNRFETILGGTPSRNKMEYWKDGTIPWINSGEINNLRITKESEFITDLALRKSASKMMPKRTTLLAITGATLGQVSLTEIECCANQSVVGIFDREGLMNEYLFLRVKEEINSIVALSGGGAQQHINKDIVNNKEILIPSKKLSNFFSQKIKHLFDEVSSLIFLNMNLSKTRDLLIPQLVTGRRELK